MNRQVTAVAAVSAVALVVLVARYDALAQGPRWSQATAQARAQQTARALGLDSTDLQVTTTAILRDDLLRFMEDSLPVWPDFFSPLRYAVRVESKSRRLSFRSEYTPWGKLLRWDCSPCGDRSDSPRRPEDFLSLFAGNHLSEFVLRDQGGTEGTSRWSWSGRSGEKLEARVTLEHGQLTSMVMAPDIPDETSHSRTMPRFDSALKGVSISIEGSALTLAGILAFLRGRKKRALWRVGLAVSCFWIGAFVLALLMNGYHWPSEEMFMASQTGAEPSFFSSHLLQQPCLWWLPCAAGLLLIRGPLIGRWLGFLHAAERWHPARRTGQELWNGLLLGWTLALPPYVAAIFGGPVWNAISPRVGFEFAPALAGLIRRTPVSGEVVVYFAFLIPLTLKFIPNQRWRRIALALTALGLFGWIGGNLPANSYLNAVSGVLLAISAIWIYRGHGLLGVCASTWGASMAVPLAWLMTTPVDHAAALILSGASYAGALAGAAWVSRRATPGEDEDLAAEVARRNEAARDLALRSEREVLRAEFAEAREAQMGMLPEKPPVIPGFSIAAVCQPAREVGGDLYDFVEFPDGHWGFCVADVSGKGVPAALYMTMTKGLLASEGRVAGDLNELVLALNEPLYLAGRKKTFVTLVMARLDPSTRALEIIRAGHNPVLWRRPGHNETVYLQPDGLGLGLVSNKTLRKKLQLETIQLEPGDTVLLYSDGLTEAENPEVELFGEERLLRIVEHCDALTAEELMQAVLAGVEVFKQGADPHDDLTLLIVKVLSPPADSPALPA